MATQQSNIMEDCVGLTKIEYLLQTLACEL